MNAIGFKCIEDGDLNSRIARLLYGTEIAIASLSRPIRIAKDGEEDKNNYPGDALRQDKKDRTAKEDESFTQQKTALEASAKKKGLTVEITRKEGNI